MKTAALFFSVFLFLLPTHLPAQGQDNTWLLGYDGGSISINDTTFGISILRFPDGDLTIENNQQIALGFKTANASISDAQGRLLFYTNGVSVWDSSHHQMQNGGGLNVPSSFGYNLAQGVLILPFPGKENQYVLLDGTRGYINEPGWYQVVTSLNRSIVDMSQNNGLGKIVLKQAPLIVDTLQLGKVTAARHGNGRDWWVLVNEANTNRYYALLLDTAGIRVHHSQAIGLPSVKGLGQAVFSPDGKNYAMFNTVSIEIGQFVEIYKFDRCTGLLEGHTQFHYDEDAYTGGIAISPNSRFLYVPSYQYLYQFDLWADDIVASKETVGEYDGFLNPFPTFFYQAQLAPDGKIYIATMNSSRVLHVIHRPNEKGTACMFEQHGLHLPVRNASSIPNMPNYRLGPLDTSPCDTLGLNNLPIAKYRYEQDTTDYLQVEFTDLSYYEPATWSWDFGHGGATSSEASPVHVFPGSGSYEVCLTVANQYGQHSFCRSLSLGTVSSAEEARAVGVTLFPNPCREAVNVIISDYLPRSARVLLFDAVGRQVLSQPIVAGWNTVRLEGLAAGVYFYQVREACAGCPGGEVLLDGGKVVRVE